jgi:hypothetical protein
MSRENHDDGWEQGRSGCGPECPCLCHDVTIEDPGPHHVLCAWADPDFSDWPEEW